ncbi:hypothetical protein DFR58_1373 [Anaerobacterium chartisolvens]|uniref:Uncharacterized protein n=1 Tax=Anaerobacterium chartisolvens TaxID=1297424 RepID=A0A369AIS4_9FIRM|nr:hypothetical protein [Anaerobacterium chartisolvens]RCX09289.1 hypothetical protein DFR58_1373 [Anaerobacterium chartisolvens]
MNIGIMQFLTDVFLGKVKNEELEGIILIRQAKFCRTLEYNNEKDRVKEGIKALGTGKDDTGEMLALEDDILDLENICYRDGYMSALLDLMLFMLLSHVEEPE